jgi:REP element-mobilizing transposase RayT
VRRTHVAIFVHLVWGTWDRLPQLAEELQRPAYRAIEAKCRELKAEVIAVGGVEDHVHLLVQLPATLSVADLMSHVKGAASHLMTHQLASDRFFKWQGAYAAFSVSHPQLDPLIAYIARQSEHHASASITQEWELPPEDESSPAPASS